jgi:NitT/TauT family transport system substrate-binding protein
MRSTLASHCARLAAALVALAAAPPLEEGHASAEEPKAVFGIPGIPPVFAGVIALVAEKEGFFKKYGVDGTVRPFDSGASAARAVAAGDIEISLSPTPLVVNQVSNSDVKLVAIYGLEHPDFFLGSTDPAVATCNDVARKPVGVESIGGARTLALKEMLATCGLKLEDVQQVALGANIAQAMIAGQLKVGVLHLDEAPDVEARAKVAVKTLITLKDASPVSHYLVAVANRDRVAKDRSLYVKMLAGIIEARRFMQDPAHAAEVAQIAGRTGHAPAEAQRALRQYLAMEFWPDGRAGLTPKNLESVIEKQVAIGGIRPGKKPVTVEQLADESLWRDAVALTRSR